MLSLAHSVPNNHHLPLPFNMAAMMKQAGPSTEPPSTASETAPSERKRPGPKPTVCAACHSAKIRCDKGSPCSNCVKRKLDCVFEDKSASSATSTSRRRRRRSLSVLDRQSAAKRPAREEERASQGDASVVVHLPAQFDEALSSGMINFDTFSFQQDQQPRTRKANATLIDIGTPASARITEWDDNVDDDDEVAPDDVGWIRRSNDDAVQLVPSLLTPNTDYVSKTWFDHLLSFFGPDPYAARRRVKSLLTRANQHINHMHRFELTNPQTIQTAIKQPERLQAVDSAMIFALTAMGLRIEGRRSLAASSSMWEILPRDAVSSPETPFDLSMQLQSVAETYMVQGLSSDPQSLEMLIRVAHASAYLMTLQLELSETYLHYHRMAMSVIKSNNMRAFIQSDDVPIRTSALGRPDSLSRQEWGRVQLRASTLREEAVRLKLFPFWAMIQLGSIFPNVEFAQLGLDPTDLEDAPVNLSWPSDESRGSTAIVQRTSVPENEVEMAVLTVEAVQIVSNCVHAWSVPHTLDYTEPDADFAKLLCALESAEKWLVQIRAMASRMLQDPVILRRYAARYCVVIGHLNGLIIRRIGFLHNAALRPGLVAAIKASRTGATNEERAQAASIALQQHQSESPATASGLPIPQQKSERLFAWQEPLDSPGLQAWLEMIQQMTHDIDEQRARSTKGPAAAAASAVGAGEWTSSSPPAVLSRTGNSETSRPTTSDGTTRPTAGALHWAPDTHQLDSLVLYAAATLQYSEGVCRLYRILGHPAPHNVPLAAQLKTAAEQLRQRIDARRRELDDMV